MAIDKQILNFFPHEVVIQSFNAKNSYGEDTHSGSTRTVKAYVEPVKVLTNDTTRNEENQPKQAYISDTNITLRDKITLPDGTIPEISRIEKHDYVTGLEHTIVTFL